MPNFPRTDLAVEAEAIHRSAAAVTELPGVRAEETERRGFAVTEVHVLDVAGENVLCKPIGDYYTLALDPLLRREDDAFENAAQTLAELLRGVLPLMPGASVLVVGLGNRAITPDAVGPDAVDSVMVTRHLREQLPEHFGQFRSVAALAPGVLGTTGVESADMIRALADRLHPDAIIAVDALACAELDRLGRSAHGHWHHARQRRRQRPRRSEPRYARHPGRSHRPADRDRRGRLFGRSPRGADVRHSA